MEVIAKYKVGDVMVYDGAYAVIDEIVVYKKGSSFEQTHYYGNWSDGERTFLSSKGLKEGEIITEEIWNSPLYKIMREANE